MEKSCRKCAPKLAPDPFLILLNNKSSHCIQEILKVRYFKRGLSKSLKKLTLFFLWNPVPLKGQKYQKQKRSGTGDQSLFKLQNKFRKISLNSFYIIRDLSKQFWSPSCRWHKKFNLLAISVLKLNLHKILF